jgi:DNA-binding MarR family transcriptional regulator
MNHVVISTKQIAKMLGISVSKVGKLRKSLIKKGYMKEVLSDDGSILTRVTSPNPNIALHMKNRRSLINYV